MAEHRGVLVCVPSVERSKFSPGARWEVLHCSNYNIASVNCQRAAPVSRDCASHLRAALADLFLGQENWTDWQTSKTRFTLLQQLASICARFMPTEKNESFYFPLPFIVAWDGKGSGRRKTGVTVGMLGYHCSDVWRHGGTLGVKHLGGAQGPSCWCCLGLAGVAQLLGAAPCSCLSNWLKTLSAGHSGPLCISQVVQGFLSGRAADSSSSICCMSYSSGPHMHLVGWRFCRSLDKGCVHVHLSCWLCWMADGGGGLCAWKGRGAPEHSCPSMSHSTVDLMTHLCQPNPIALAHSAQTMSASTSQPTDRCRIAAGLVYK